MGWHAVQWDVARSVGAPVKVPETVSGPRALACLAEEVAVARSIFAQASPRSAVALHRDL